MHLKGNVGVGGRRAPGQPSDEKETARKTQAPVCVCVLALASRSAYSNYPNYVLVHTLLSIVFVQIPFSQ